MKILKWWKYFDYKVLLFTLIWTGFSYHLQQICHENLLKPWFSYIISFKLCLMFIKCSKVMFPIIYLSGLNVFQVSVILVKGYEYLLGKIYNIRCLWPDSTLTEMLFDIHVSKKLQCLTVESFKLVGPILHIVIFHRFLIMLISRFTNKLIWSMN